MLLMDAIVSTAETAVSQGIARESIFPIYTALASKINPPEGPIPPRYAFDAKAIMTATELTMGRPKVFRDVMRYTQIPYPIMWVEWDDLGREELRKKFEQDPRLAAFRPLPVRMGFLIEAEPPTYRRGQIRWAWTSKEGGGLGIPNCSPIFVEFDLDGDWPIDFFDDHPLQLATLWEDNPLQQRELFSVWRTAHHYESPYVRALSQDRVSRELLYADVVGEYIMVWACLFLLTASRRPLDYRHVDMSRLNKHRVKARKTPLLDHQTVHIHLRAPTPKEMARGPLDYRRKSPHIHHVSSYMGHRGTDHWLVLPYMRGSGPPTARTRHVHG